MKTVIMAGGKGTRISSVANDIPKPMIKIGGKPVLEHEIECLREQGFTDIILTVGHMGKIISEHFGNGNSFGVNIDYYFEERPLGNAGALFKIKNKLNDDFLLINADSVFDIDFDRFVNYHNEKNGLATLFTHPNGHPYDSSLIIADENFSVTKWLSKEDVRPKYYKNRVNAGLHIISPKILEINIQKEKIDLDRDLLKPLAGTGKMYCYDSPEYVKDMGTPERYEAVCDDLYRGKIHAKNLKNKQKAIFLDRDGTVNKYVGFLKNIDDFELADGAAEAVKKINSSGFLAIVITNQPVIARGDVTFAELREIHNKMEMLLGKKGAFLDGIYFCPHHPDSGYEGEISELKIECECRKPRPGLIFQAARDFNINLKNSWFAGDGENDIKAGKNAGCKTALIGKENYGQDISVGSLFEFAEVMKW